MFAPAALITTLVAALASASSPNSRTQAPDIVGTWRGTSLCVDKEHHPSCNDEQAVYEIRPKSRDTVTVKAQKIVGGALELVSEDDFARQPDGSWRVNLVTPRFRIRITLRVTGDSLSGTLVELADSRKARDIALKRQR